MKTVWFLTIALWFLLLLFQGNSVDAWTFPPRRHSHASQQSDPYKVLGIRRDASLEDIKKAYRQKAKERHPDKNLDMDPEVAAEQFRQVVDAFELLSDPDRKRRYDSQQQEQQQRNNNNYNNNDRQRRQREYDEQQRRKQEQERQRQEQEYRRRKAEIYPQAQRLQSRVLRISKLEELQYTMFDSYHRSHQSHSHSHSHSYQKMKYENMHYNRYFLGVFVATKQAEKYLDEELLFPFPFAGIGKNNIEWEDVLQTIKIRYNSPTSLTQLYHVPSVQHVKANGNMPFIVFARKGDPIGKFQVYQHPSRNSNHQHPFVDPQAHLEAWVYEQLVVKVNLVNKHHSDIKLFMKDDEGIKRFNGILRSGQGILLAMRISDKIMAIDARVDQFPGATFNQDLLQEANDNVLLANVIIKGEPIVEIGERNCFDLSLRCSMWDKHMVQPCETQPEFMHNICGATCGICSENTITSFVKYGFLHYPTRKMPKWLRGMVQFLRVLSEDMIDVLSLRRNVVFVFLVLGTILGVNLVILKHWVFRNSRPQPLSSGGSGQAPQDAFWTRRNSFNLYLFAGTIATWVWIAMASKLPRGLLLLQEDIHHVLRWQVDALVFLLLLGVVMYFVGGSLLPRVWHNSSRPRRNKILLSLLVLICFCLSVITSTYVLVTLDYKRDIRWRHMLNMRKNVTTALWVSGIIVGATYRSVLYMIWNHLPRPIVLVIADVGVFKSLTFLSSFDNFFLDDMAHVLQFRMNAMVAFVVIGCLFGVLISHIWTLDLKRKISSKKPATRSSLV